MSGPDSSAGQPAATARLLQTCLSTADRAIGWAGTVVCRMPAIRQVAYRLAYTYLASVITEYDRADEMSGADVYDFIGEWMIANKIPIFNITGYDGSDQPVYQQDQET